jgi:voltage-gated potassium channel
MNPEKHFKWIMFLLVSIMAIGVFGLMLIEDWSFLDALYMTVITMSTVGYKEIYPLSTEGKVFVIVLIILGVGSFFYIVTITAEYIISGHLKGAIGRKKMKKEVDALNNHYIVCGFGRVGEQVAGVLDSERKPFVIVDNNPEALQRCNSLGYLFIEGDASNDEVLKNAGIFKAKGLVSAIDSDADNVYVTLSAKGIRNDLFVVARANREGSEHKLLKAGADRVISPYSIGGRRLASLLLRPAVVEFMDVVMHNAEIELFMEEIIISKESPFIGNTMGEARVRYVTGTNILAIKKREETKMIANPPVDTLIEEGDKLVALGTKEQLKELEGMT